MIKRLLMGLALSTVLALPFPIAFGATVKVLVVAGGGGGGGNTGGTTTSGAGGGAGGSIYNASFSIDPGSHNVIVGVGGIGGTGVGQTGITNGGNSSFSSLTAAGGGSGAGSVAGGSGGGGSMGGGGGAATPAGQGNAGGGSTSSPRWGSGGGGGEGAPGTSGTTTAGGNGGNGLSNSISGAAVTYCGGGGGTAYWTDTQTAGSGGSGGGGAGTLKNGNGNNAGGYGSGGGAAGSNGGGGNSDYKGGNGSGGIVIISYATADFIGYAVTGGMVTISGSTTIRTFTTSGTLSITALSAIELYQTSLINDANLIAYWRMEGNSTDSKGNRNGTDTSVSYSSNHGIFGQGASFDGSNSWISLPTLDLGAGDRTLCVWFKAPDQTEGKFFSSRRNGDVGYPWWEFGVGANGYIHAAGYSAYPTGLGAGGYATSPYGDGGWHFAVFVLGGGHATIYYDGAVLDDRTGTVPNTNTGVLSQIGQASSNNGASPYGRFNGQMDDVALFSRVLSATEIINLYKGTYPTPTPTPTNTPTGTPTPTPTPTSTRTPTRTPTLTPTPEPPTAPVIASFTHNSSGQVMEICGTTAVNTTVTLYDGGTPLAGSATPDGSGRWCYTPAEPLAAGQHSITATATYAGSNPSPGSSLNRITSRNAINAYKDTETRHSGETSLRLDKTGSDEVNIAVNGSAPVTVKAWMTKNAAYAGTAPKITLSGLGIDGTGNASADLSATLPGWEQLTVSGTPAGSKGVLTLKVETFGTNDGASAWIDDISVAQ